MVWAFAWARAGSSRWTKRAALAQVGEGDGVLAQTQVAGDALESGALEARRAAGDDEVVEPALLDRLADQVVALGAAHELVDGDADDAVERARTASARLCRSSTPLMLPPHSQRKTPALI